MPINDSSKSATKNLMTEALTSALGEVYSGDMQIDCGDFHSFKNQIIYMITISGMSFRAVGALQLSDSALSRKIASNRLNIDGGIEKEDFFDFYQELTNSCFGIAKRLMGGQFAQLGMSTPYLLSSDISIERLVPSNSDFNCHCIGKIEGEVAFGASMFLFSQDEFQFSYARTQTASNELQVEAGALEFF